MTQIILNATGSPVQIQIKKAISKTKGSEYTYLELVIGRSGDPYPVVQRVFLRSPRDYAYVAAVLADGADAVLVD